MNPNTPPPSDDDLPDERELKALYGRLPKTEPDAALDASILAAATRATPVRRRPRWPVALGSAAVLVLAAGVGWQMRDAPIRDTATERAQSLQRPAPPAAVAPVPAPAIAPPTAADAAPMAETRAAAKPAVSAPMRKAAARHAPMAEGMVTSAAPWAAPAPVPAPAPAPAAPAEPPSPPPPPAPPADLAPAAAEQAFAPAPAPAGAPAMQMQLRAAPKVAPLGPDDRVGEIRRLLDHGDRDEALRKLAELRRLYPAYALPQDLRDLKP
ncbi:hypothetical protein [Luteibacter yeojuensis]|uniref:hypothetical protein n=1 Tax=Luteibacter yeojuensis TaxID=345309 RepID=UPI0006965565|nr:hypothetical protein [Luteibacter yeojuensis]